MTAETFAFSMIFKHKEFMLFHVQGLPSYVLQRAYISDRKIFMQTVLVVPHASIPKMPILYLAVSFRNSNVWITTI